MKYYLLKTEDGEPMEMLGFPEGMDMQRIKTAICVLDGMYWDSIRSDGYASGLSECEFIAEMLCENYQAELLPWDNSDNLYY